MWKIYNIWNVCKPVKCVMLIFNSFLLYIFTIPVHQCEEFWNYQCCGQGHSLKAYASEVGLDIKAGIETSTPVVAVKATVSEAEAVAKTSLKNVPDTLELPHKNLKKRINSLLAAPKVVSYDSVKVQYNYWATKGFQILQINFQSSWSFVAVE